MTGMRLGVLTLVTAFAITGNDVHAQLTISGPVENAGPPVSAGPIRQVSLATPEGIVAARPDASTAAQIRVKVHYLMVDDATRAAIYQSLDAKSIKNFTSVAHDPTTHDPTNSDPKSNEQASDGFLSDQASAGCREHVVTPTRMSTCLLDPLHSERIQAKVRESSASEIVKSPAIILLEGEDAEMNDLVQRAFLVDFRRRPSSPSESGPIESGPIESESSESGSDDVRSGEAQYEPVVKAYDEGTRVRLVSFRPPMPLGKRNAIHLTAQVTFSRILDVSSETVYGFGDEPMTLQTPHYQIKTATASEVLTAGQIILVDPHVRQTKLVRGKTGVPILGKLPYVFRSFKTVQEIEVEQSLILLIQPSLVP